MRVITLGTGAGRPTLQRLTSAVALEFEGETFLFDCGEGAQVQLMHSPLKWGKFTAIFLTHLHGDHLYGLPGLLGTMSLSERSLPLKVFGPRGLKAFLQVMLDTRSLWIRFPLEIVEIEKPGILFEGKRYRVETIPLKHSVACWGFAFCEKERPGKFNHRKAEKMGIGPGPLRARLVQGETVQLENGTIVRPEELLGPSRRGRRVAFCWDTQPCPESLQLARGADALFHEATFGEDLGEEAHAFGHSTAADAARAAKEGGVRQLVITHISQRYQEDQVLLDEARAIFPATRIAADLEEFEVIKRD